MKTERSSPSVGKEAQTKATDEKETEDGRYSFPKVQKVISGGYRGPYPLIKKANKPKYHFKTRISDNWGN